MAEWEKKVHVDDLNEVKQIVKEHEKATGTPRHLETVFNTSGTSVIQPDFARDVSEILKQERNLTGSEEIASKQLAQRKGAADVFHFYGIMHGAQAARLGMRGVDVYSTVNRAKYQYDATEIADFTPYDVFIENGIFPHAHLIEEYKRTKKLPERSALRDWKYAPYLSKYHKQVPNMWLLPHVSEYGGETTCGLDVARRELDYPAKIRPNLLGKFTIKVHGIGAYS